MFSVLMSAQFSDSQSRMPVAAICLPYVGTWRNGSTSVAQPERSASRQPSCTITARSSPVIVYDTGDM